MSSRKATKCLLEELVGKTVVELSRVVLENERANYRTVMDDTLVFNLPDERRFLAGAILWNADREALVSIYTESDEIELTSKGRLNALIDEMPFIYGSVESRWYNHTN